MGIKKPSARSLWIAVAVVLAFGLRLYSALRLPIDYDEVVYLSNSMIYAQNIREGHYNMVAWWDQNYEHPAFAKVLNGVLLTALPTWTDFDHLGFATHGSIYESPIRDYALVSRMLNVVFGTAAVLLVGLISPPAAFLLAIHSYAVKYTSVIYLEAIPAFFSVLSVWAFLEWEKARGSTARRRILGIPALLFWPALSALGLGAATASKYTYAVTGLVILLYALIRWAVQRLNWFTRAWFASLGWLILWGLTAVLLFFVCDPYLWPHPISRLEKSINYHLDYENSAHVIDAGYPVYQPLLWLSRPAQDQPDDAIPHHAGDILFGLDLPILILAAAGLPWTFKRQPLFALWFLIGLGFLLYWNTKWPQYVVLVLAPLCVSAGVGLSALILEPAGRWLSRRRPNSQTG